MISEASFGGGPSPSPPPPPRKKKKKKKEKKEKEKEKREKREKRKKGTMNSVKLLHIKCCFFQFFNSPVALKKKFGPPRKSWNDAPKWYINNILTITRKNTHPKYKLVSGSSSCGLIKASGYFTSGSVGISKSSIPSMSDKLILYRNRSNWSDLDSL